MIIDTEDHPRALEISCEAAFQNLISPLKVRF